jgi:hypothetical protein
MKTNLPVFGTVRIRHSEMLKLSIKNAIKKSSHGLLQRCLFRDETDGQCDQFVGFVSSHTTGKIVDAFHLHSFAVFHTTKGKETIVTCILTARNHILSNMQDRVLQLMQLIQSLTTLLEWMSSYPNFLRMVMSQWDLMSNH